MKKSKISYLLSVPLLLLVLLLAACEQNGLTDGGGGEPGVAETPAAETPAAGAETPAAETPAAGAETPAAETPAAEPQVGGGEGGFQLQVEEHDQLGAILTDGEGMTLYMLEADQPGESTCTDACAEAWPPVIIQSDPEVGDQVNTTIIGVIRRPDGQNQLTYNQHPLYYFQNDEAASDVKGHQVESDWGTFVAVSPEGEPIQTGQGG